MKEIEENTVSKSLSVDGWEELSDEELSVVIGGRTIFARAISKVTGTAGKVAGFVKNKILEPIDNSKFLLKFF